MLFIYLFTLVLDLLSENTDILQSSKKILKIEVSRSQFRQNLNIVIPRKIMIIINRKVSKSNDETYVHDLFKL